MFLIVGASGFIGNKVYDYFKSKGVEVKGTYCSRPFESGIYFGLNNWDSPHLKDLTHIFLCSGIGDIDKCKTNRDSYRINVTNTIKLLENFRGVIPIYLSTDMVYNGDKGNYTESDRPSPVTEYGKQKVEVEYYIKTHFSKYIIVRLTKVFGVGKNDQTLLTSCLGSLEKHRPIPSADDTFISPVYIMDVVHALDGLVTGEHYGVFNLGGNETATRYDLLQKLAVFFGYDPSLIKRRSTCDFNFVEPRPLYSSLDSTKLINTTGIKLTPLDDCFELMKTGRE